MKLPAWIALPNILDPEDRRRRQILNIILSFFITGGLIMLIVTFSYGDSLMEIVHDPDGLPILLGCGLGVAVLTGLLLLNRWKRAGSAPGWLFILSLILMILLSDSPTELLSRSSVLWTLPILAGGIVLPPLAVYPVTVLVSLINEYISQRFLHEAGNPYLIATYFLFAFLTWLGMSIANGAIRTAHQEAQKNAAILNGVADGVVVLDEENHVVLANPIALDLMGDNITQLVSTARERRELGGRVLAFEWSHVQEVGRVAIVRDVSRQVEIERAKDAMLGVVSHEMRTPLAAIIGFAEMIPLRLEQAADMAARIEVNARRLVLMVDDLLDQAQIQAGTLKIRHEAVSLRSILEKVEGMMSGLAEKKGLVLRTELDPNLPQEIVGDPNRLQQVLVNLAGNAVKFSEAGQVVIRFEKHNSEWRMLVRDEGMGIPPERLPDIFEPFRRASDYATRYHQGAGLGLSIVKNLVTLMGGRIVVESQAGRGSTFTVILPLEEMDI